MIDRASVSTYPGAELISAGLDDLSSGQLTIAACLVSIARPSMEASGLAETIPKTAYVAEPHQTLYRLLQTEGNNAYGRYNSLLRRLVSFERALRHAKTRREALRPQL